MLSHTSNERFSFEETKQQPPVLGAEANAEAKKLHWQMSYNSQTYVYDVTRQIHVLYSQEQKTKKVDSSDHQLIENEISGVCLGLYIA